MSAICQECGTYIDDGDFCSKNCRYKASSRMIDYSRYEWEGDARKLTQLYTTASEYRLIMDARIILEALKAAEEKNKKLEKELERLSACNVKTTCVNAYACELFKVKQPSKELTDNELYNIVN